MRIIAGFSFYVFLIFSTVYSCAQTENPMVGLGSWRIHLPYYDGRTVAEGNGKVYCATQYGLFSYNTADGSMNRYSRVSGMSDLEIATIRYSPEDRVLFVAYTNANIDLIYDDNTIYNMPEMKDKNIVGGKYINHILFLNQSAYLSCSFGIVVIDLNKKEIKDTYYIGPNGNSINVHALASDGNQFLAATDTGIYVANVNDPFLANYTQWTRNTTLPNPTGSYTSVATFAGKVLVVYRDTLKLVYDGTTWSDFAPFDHYPESSFDVQNNSLMLKNNFSLAFYDTSFNRAPLFYDGQYNQAQPNFAIRNNKGIYWIADNNNGLVRVENNQYQFIQPNSPVGLVAGAMQSGKEGLWVAGGLIVGTNCGPNPKGMYWFHENEWKSFYQQNDPLYNSLGNDCLLNLAIDPDDGKHVFAGTRGHGLLEYRENGSIMRYDTTNSPIRGIGNKSNDIWIGGVSYDQDGNLWVLSNLNNSLLSEKKKDGTWKSFSIGATYSNNYMFGLMVDSYNQKWINPTGLGLIVYNENNPDNPNDESITLLTTVEGKGNLPSLSVFSMVQDKDGVIWLGTDQGVAVIYNPGSVFSGSNYDAQKILIEFEGHTQYLLATERVNAIAVDGANRKWFGTLNSGVYLMSADGTKQIYHFDVDNSPLLANFVYSIAIDPVTGEVFFGTERGICSFRSDATEGGDVCDNYYVFPNPIRHEYRGSISIKGLVANASVKIADTGGQLVYQTKALGGQAVWDGNNFNGERAHTGVYLVYVTNEDGSSTCVTKMLFMN